MSLGSFPSLSFFLRPSSLITGRWVLKGVVAFISCSHKINIQAYIDLFFCVFIYLLLIFYSASFKCMKIIYKHIICIFLFSFLILHLFLPPFFLSHSNLPFFLLPKFPLSPFHLPYSCFRYSSISFFSIARHSYVYEDSL